MSTKGVWADYQKTMVISGNNLFVCIYVKQLHMISKQIKFHHSLSNWRKFATKRVWACYHKTMVIIKNYYLVCLYVNLLHIIWIQSNLHHYNQIQEKLLRRGHIFLTQMAYFKPTTYLDFTDISKKNLFYIPRISCLLAI